MERCIGNWNTQLIIITIDMILIAQIVDNVTNKASGSVVKKFDFQSLYPRFQTSSTCYRLGSRATSMIL